MLESIFFIRFTWLYHAGNEVIGKTENRLNIVENCIGNWRCPQKNDKQNIISKIIITYRLAFMRFHFVIRSSLIH